MIHNKRALIVFLAETAVMLALICLFSSQDSEVSSLVSGGVSRWLYNHIPHGDMKFWKFHRLIRKAAHFTEFALLGQALMSLLCAVTRKGFPWLEGGAALLGAALYAGADELHQLFVSGRSGDITDVLIDSSGALTGIVLTTLVILMATALSRRRRKRRKA